MGLPLRLLSGVPIDSELVLSTVPLASSVEGYEPLLQLRLGRVQARPSTPWQRRENGIELAEAPQGHLIHVEDEATFLIDHEGRCVLCEIVPDTPMGVIEQLFIDQIWPIVLRIRGRFSLHASAVTRQSGVIAFLADTGFGKSTLASSLAAAGRGQLFSDDCLAVTFDEDRAMAEPSYDSARLWPESAGALFGDRGELARASPITQKRRVALPWSEGPRPLLRLYLLERADEPPTIRYLGRAEAFGRVLLHLNRFGLPERGRLVEEADFLERLVTAVPVARLAYRRDFSELPLVHATVSADEGRGPRG